MITAAVKELHSEQMCLLLSGLMSFVEADDKQDAEEDRGKIPIF